MSKPHPKGEQPGLPGAQVGPGKASVGYCSLGWGLGPGAPGWSLLCTRKHLGGPPTQFSVLPPTASKGNSLGTICLWSWSQTWVGRGKQSTLAVVVLARLQWSPTKLAYFSLSTCPGEGIVLCGDEEGNVWVYDVRHILTQPPPLPAAPQAPTQILKWPQPWALGQMVTKTMVNMVVANPTFTYLTALTDSNIVAIWKRQ